MNLILNQSNPLYLPILYFITPVLVIPSAKPGSINEALTLGLTYSKYVDIFHLPPRHVFCMPLFFLHPLPNDPNKIWGRETRQAMHV